MKKNFIIPIAIAILCTFALSANAFAAETNEVVTVGLDRCLSVTYSGAKQDLFDANGKRVFPITRGGTTYIPVRAISNLLNISIEWIGSENKIVIGASAAEKPTYTPERYDAVISNESVYVTVVKDLTIMYNGEIQSFFDVNGVQVYPIMYNKTTYLPIRAVGKMLGFATEWIGSENCIAIVEGKVEPPEVTVEPSDPYVIKDIDKRVYMYNKGRDVYAGYDTSKLSEANKELVGTNGFINVKTSETEEWDGGYEYLFKFNFDKTKRYMTLKIKNNGTTDIAVGYSQVGEYSNGGEFSTGGGRELIKPGETVTVQTSWGTVSELGYDYLDMRVSPTGVLDTPIDVIFYDFMLKDDWK